MAARARFFAAVSARAIRREAARAAAPIDRIFEASGAARSTF
jgi:hypothetical protein